MLILEEQLSLLQRPISDHFPILLERGEGVMRGPTPFRFENMWTKEENFKDFNQRLVAESEI